MSNKSKASGFFSRRVSLADTVGYAGGVDSGQDDNDRVQTVAKGKAKERRESGRSMVASLHGCDETLPVSWKGNLPLAAGAMGGAAVVDVRDSREKNAVNTSSRSL